MQFTFIVPRLRLLFRLESWSHRLLFANHERVGMENRER